MSGSVRDGGAFEESGLAIFATVQFCSMGSIILNTFIR